MSERPAWRVFLSHTSELRKFPVSGSFVAAAEEAVTRAKDAILDMAYFESRDTEAAATCRGEVAEADVFVLIAGFCYGSVVIDEPGLSYVELEYAEAGELGMDRLVFLLGEEAEGPRALFHDPKGGDRQESFRTRLQRENTCVSVRNPGELTTALVQALVRLRE